MQKDDLKTKTLLVYDNGLFVSMAVRLAKDFKKVMYYSVWKNAFPKSNGALIGEGLDEIERVNNFFDAVEEADVIWFPDVYDGDLQIYLEENGKRVFGSKKGEELELLRWETKDHLKELGLPVQPVRRIIGLPKLREYLKANENKYVKVSIYRGDFETFCSHNYKLSEPLLDDLENHLGAKKYIEEFIVEDAIDGKDVVEVGYDGYTVDGKYPATGLFGYEIKDLGYCGVVKKYEDLSPLVTDFNAAISSTLEKYSYRNFFSTEIRVGKEKVPYMMDFCARTGSPPSELYQEMIKNMAEIIWYGSDGILIEPEFDSKYGIEVMIHSNWADGSWQAIYFPEEIKRFVKLRNMTKINGTYYVVPQYSNLPEIGAVVALGSSIEECIKKVKGYIDQIEGYQIDIQIGSIDSMIQTIAAGEKLGIKF